jgi:hypothetical protein
MSDAVFRMAYLVAKEWTEVTPATPAASFYTAVSRCIGSSSAMEAFMGWRLSMRTCPQKLNTLELTVSWNPFTTESVMIITATLMAVAPMESRMMNLEKDFCWLKAILRAIKEEMFTIISYLLPGASNLCPENAVCQYEGSLILHTSKIEFVSK